MNIEFGCGDNTQSFEQELNRRLDQMRMLLDVTNKITSHLDLRELFKAIADSIHQIFNCDGTGLTLYDQEKGQLRAYTVVPRLSSGISSQVYEGELLQIEGTPLESVLSSLQTVLVTYDDLKKATSPLIKQAVAEGIRSAYLAPLISRGKVLGTLNIVSLREDVFTKEDALLLNQIANQIAIAVENALNFERAKEAERQVARERDHWRLLLDINNAVVFHLNMKELLSSISASLHDLMPHEAAGVALYEPEQNHLRMMVLVKGLSAQNDLFNEGELIPVEGTPTGLVFSSGKPLLLRRPDPEKFPADRTQFMPGGRRSSCVVPLISHGRKIGVMGIGSSKEDAYTEDNLELLIYISGQVAIAVENALAYREIEALKNKLTQEKLYLEEELQSEWNFEQIIGSSSAFKRVLKQVETVAPTDSTVLIQGETGTGKEIIARAIHNLSGRRDRTLVKLNCAAIPNGLIESELFGHEKGAFTGAIAQRIGRFELAHRGTLFLDEVGEIPLELQPKLLRVLQEQEFERLGSTRTQRVDARLVAATNRDLAQMVENNQFRRDLYYRLNVFPLTIPPLRERPEDIPSLVRFFASKFATRMRKRIETIPTEAMAALTNYHWPGNIRELENLIERATILSQGPQLEVPLTELKTKTVAEPSLTAISTAITLEATEREHILRILRETNWVVGGPAGAAARLGMKRTTLQSKMQKLGISR
jgi:formate hydrogenlyase transcriptional activator